MKLKVIFHAAFCKFYDGQSGWTEHNATTKLYETASKMYNSVRECDTLREVCTCLFKGGVVSNLFDGDLNPAGYQSHRDLEVNSDPRGVTGHNIMAPLPPNKEPPRRSQSTDRGWTGVPVRNRYE